MSRRAKILGIAIVLIAFLIVSFNSLSVTGLSVLDTDASTYIIVVMLMIFVFICFGAKADINFEYNKKNILYSGLVFLLYIVLLSFLRVALSFSFLSYRIDALLFPLPLLALILLIFGTSGAKKLLPLIIYAAFASPLILLPLLNLNGAFANLNAILVFNLIKALGAPVSRIGLMITAISGASITVSTTCVSIGTFAALVMFLIPVAYLYDGKKIMKFYWILSAFLLMLLLNVARMIFIALIWVFYGLNSAVNTFHLFAGQLIFYAIMVIMVLIASKYELFIPQSSKKKKTKRKAQSKSNDWRLAVPIAIAIIFAIIGFTINYGYSSSIYAPALLFGGNATQASLNQHILASLGSGHSNIVIISTTPIGELFALTNGSRFNNSIFVVTNVSHIPVSKNNLENYTPITPSQSYLLKNGVTLTGQRVVSDNTIFDINYFSLPYNVSGNWLTVNYAMFRIVNGSGNTNCAISYNQTGQINYFDSVIYNIINTREATNQGVMCQGYLVGSSG